MRIPSISNNSWNASVTFTLAFGGTLSVTGRRLVPNATSTALAIASGSWSDLNNNLSPIPPFISGSVMLRSVVVHTSINGGSETIQIQKNSGSVNIDSPLALPASAAAKFILASNSFVAGDNMNVLVTNGGSGQVSLVAYFVSL